MLTLAFCLLYTQPVSTAPRVVLLKDLVATPDAYLGSKIAVDAMLLKGTPAVDKRRSQLTVGKDLKDRVISVRFIVSNTIAEAAAQELKGDGAQARFVGVVVAPAKPNAPYELEIEQLTLLKADGSVLWEYQSSVTPVAVKTNPTPPPASAAPTATPEPVKEPEANNTSTFLAALIALAVGLGVGVFVVLRRRRPKTPPPPPSMSVSERLNRRVR